MAKNPSTQNGHNAIRQAREAAGLSQAALGQLAGLPQQTVARLESQRSPFLQKLRRIAAALKVPEQTLLGAPAHELAPAAESSAAKPLERLDTTLLRRVVLFVEERGAPLGERLSSPERARLVCAVYEMALRDCAELEIDGRTIDLDRYLPVLDIALDRSAA